ncbi:MAG: MYXO-CTERM domain-containing protein [Burkholderiaceae bacterium]|jgi:MYXO-CTERM domain-containing protein
MKTGQFIVLLALFSAAGFASAATATYDFSNLKANGSGSSFLPSEILDVGYWRCTGGDLCSSNIDHSPTLGGDLKYTVNGITATATGYYDKSFTNGVLGTVASVVQDHENSYSARNKIGAGLGVYHKRGDTSDDNVTVGETLKLTFSKAVTLSAISLRSEGHNTTNFDIGSTFLLNGVKLALAGNLNFSLKPLTGTEFTFAFDNSLHHGKYNGDQFYLGGMTVSAVPETETWAMMLGGLGLLGFVARRRRADTRLH